MLTNTVALKLVQYIVENNLQVGARLPSIRELASLWDCNSSQVRTGLITLAALGVLDMHPRAGSFVKQISPADLDTLFVLFFRLGMLGDEAETLNLYAIKAMLDRETIKNAVRYRTENDLVELELNLVRQASCFEDCHSFVEADEEFHIMLAHIIRNPIVVFLLEAVQGMLRPYRSQNLTPEICRESYASHKMIFEAIKANSVEEAEKLADAHTQPRRLRLIAEEARLASRNIAV